MTRRPAKNGSRIVTAEDRALDVLGVVLAGGENRRYGDHKALATLGGRRIVDRVVSAVESAVEEVVVVANEMETYGTLGLPMRSDTIPGAGALGGILTAVLWAKERGCRAALVTACDMPFLSPALLHELAVLAEPGKVWLPESRGPRGYEPLCASYGSGCAGEIERTLERGERAVAAALSRLETEILPLDRVAAYGDPDEIFLNVNVPADRVLAEARLARGRGLRRNTRQTRTDDGS